MEIYIAICCDRHIDDDIQVFTTPGPAIQYAKDFIPDRYEIEEQELTDRMKRNGWLYLADYGTEGDHVRVETSILEIKEKPCGIDYTFANLTERAVRNAVPHIAGPSEKWVAVGDTFAVGSTVAMKICRAYGLDPHEFVHGVACILQPLTLEDSTE